MTRWPRELEAMAGREAADDAPPPTATVRELLGWFDASAPGVRVHYQIRKALRELGLKSVPNFERAALDTVIAFHRSAAPADARPPARRVAPPADPVPARTEPRELPDPTPRIGDLPGATRPPVTVAPDAALKTAITKLITTGRTHLAVTTGERSYRGVVGWRSIGEAQVAHRDVGFVRDCIAPVVVCDAADPLFGALDRMGDAEAMLVRARDGRFQGLVTWPDVATGMRTRAEPFLALAEIEQHLRNLIARCVPAYVIVAARAPSDNARSVASVSDLTFGEYVRLLERDETWQLLDLQLDRQTFVRELERIRLIRNGVMHFDPRGVGPDDREALARSVAFLRRLERRG